jgi:hypothetical protein
MLLELIRVRLGKPVYYIRNMGWFRMAMMHTKLIKLKWEMCWNIHSSLELIRDRLGDPVYYIRNMGWFKTAMMHTKLIKMQWGMFQNILQAAQVDQGQVGGPSVLQKIHGMVQDGLNAHQK